MCTTKQSRSLTLFQSHNTCEKTTNPDLEKLAHAIQHGLQGLIVKNIEAKSKCGQNLTFQEAFENATEINKELHVKEHNLMVHFAKKLNLDFQFFIKHRK